MQLVNDILLEIVFSSQIADGTPQWGMILPLVISDSYHKNDVIIQVMRFQKQVIHVMAQLFSREEGDITAVITYTYGCHRHAALNKWDDVNTNGGRSS